MKFPLLMPRATRGGFKSGCVEIGFVRACVRPSVRLCPKSLQCFDNFSVRCVSFTFGLQNGPKMNETLFEANRQNPNSITHVDTFSLLFGMATLSMLLVPIQKGD